MLFRWNSVLLPLSSQGGGAWVHEVGWRRHHTRLEGTREGCGWYTTPQHTHLHQHAPPSGNDYVQPSHLWEVQSGKGRGLDLCLPEADVCIDITWYCHPTEADQITLCGAMRSPPVCRVVGKRGRVTLLLKHPDQPVQEVNLRGITISYHISKLEPMAFYALVTAVYGRALGGPCLVGGMRGVSLQEVVRPLHMKLDMARLHCRMVDVLVTDLAKFFDAIAQDVHPMVGARVGLGDESHLATHTEGFSYALPLGLGRLDSLAQLLGNPQGMIHGSMPAPRQPSPFSGSWTLPTVPLETHVKSNMLNFQF